MIKINIFKKNNNYVGIKCVGHSGYDDFGRDIVCSAVSSLIFNAEIALNEVLKIKSKLQSNEKTAEFSLSVVDAKGNDKMVNVIFESLEISLSRLEKQFKKNVKLEVENENV